LYALFAAFSGSRDPVTFYTVLVAYADYLPTTSPHYTMQPHHTRTRVRAACASRIPPAPADSGWPLPLLPFSSYALLRADGLPHVPPAYLRMTCDVGVAGYRVVPPHYALRPVTTLRFRYVCCRRHGVPLRSDGLLLWWLLLRVWTLFGRDAHFLHHYRCTRIQLRGL